MGYNRLAIIKEKTKQIREENKLEKSKLSREKFEEGQKEKINKEYKKIISGKMSYKSGNPLKGLLKVDRPTVKVSGKKENINLMRATW